MTNPTEAARAIASEINGSKPVLASFMGGKEVLPGRQELAAAGLPDYESPERAVSALRVMYEYATWLSRPPRIVTRFRVNRRRAGRIITRSQRNRILQLNEVKAKKILDAYGFNVLPGHLVTSADEGVELARRIGFPVAMKIVSPDIIHKSDMGGVKLNLASAQQIRDGYDLMMMRIMQQLPSARIEGIYLEKMSEPGLEVILGMSRDPQFGPMLMFGLAGRTSWVRVETRARNAVTTLWPDADHTPVRKGSIAREVDVVGNELAVVDGHDGPPYARLRSYFDCLPEP